MGARSARGGVFRVNGLASITARSLRRPRVVLGVTLLAYLAAAAYLARVDSHRVAAYGLARADQRAAFLDELERFGIGERYALAFACAPRLCATVAEPKAVDLIERLAHRVRTEVVPSPIAVYSPLTLDEGVVEGGVLRSRTLPIEDALGAKGLFGHPTVIGAGGRSAAIVVETALGAGGRPTSVERAADADAPTGDRRRARRAVVRALTKIAREEGARAAVSIQVVDRPLAAGAAMRAEKTAFWSIVAASLIGGIVVAVVSGGPRRAAGSLWLASHAVATMLALRAAARGPAFGWEGPPLVLLVGVHSLAVAAYFCAAVRASTAAGMTAADAAAAGAARTSRAALTATLAFGGALAVWMASPSASLRDLGLFGAIGLALSLTLAYSALPAFLVVTARTDPSARRRSPGAPPAVAKAVGEFGLQAPRLALGLTVLAAAMAARGCWSLDLDSPMPASPVEPARSLHGIPHVDGEIDVVFRTGRPEGLSGEAGWKALVRLDTELRAAVGFDGVRSIVSDAEAIHAADDGAAGGPASPLSALLPAAQSSRWGNWVSADRSAARIALRAPLDLTGAEYLALGRRIDEAIARAFPRGDAFAASVGGARALDHELRLEAAAGARRALPLQAAALALGLFLASNSILLGAGALLCVGLAAIFTMSLVGHQVGLEWLLLPLGAVDGTILVAADWASAYRDGRASGATARGAARRAGASTGTIALPAALVAVSTYLPIVVATPRGAMSAGAPIAVGIAAGALACLATFPAMVVPRARLRERRAVD